MATIITNPSPKARFQENPQAVSQHRDLIQHPAFQRSVDFALLELQKNLTSTPIDFQASAANHFRLMGALEFLQTLRLLAETPAATVTKDRDNLPPTN